MTVAVFGLRRSYLKQVWPLATAWHPQTFYGASFGLLLTGVAAGHQLLSAMHSGWCLPLMPSASVW